MPPALRSLALLGAFLAGVPGVARAQAVRVRAVDDATGGPLVGAVADVLDAAGRVAAQGLLGRDGARVVRLAAAGTYRVRVRRVGFEPFVAPAVAVAGRDTVTVALRVPARRITLATVTVTGDRRCERGALPTGVVAQLLEAARTALTATALTRADTTLALEGRTFARALAPDLEERALEVELPHRVTAARPFASASAAELSDLGYVRGSGDGVTFHAPDERVLAADEFVRDHCFDLVPRREARPGLVGVRFVPAPRRTSEIGGTLWLDSATTALRWLDFWYLDPRVPVPATGPGRSGGEVVFDGLADGQWIVAAWRLRMPRFAGERIDRNTRPVGYEEIGGVVTPVAADTADTAPRVATDPAVAAPSVAPAPNPALPPYLELLRPARVAGVAWDSLAGRAAAGALVRLEPAPGAPSRAPNVVVAVPTLVDTADAEGRYAFDSLPAGAYRIGLAQPALDSAGVPLPRFDIRLRPGVSVEGPLAVPSRATLADRCARAPGRGDGLLFGVVRAADSRLPLENALVRVTWGDVSAVGRTTLVVPLRETVTRTDRAGRYRVCGVPQGVQLGVQAFALTASSGLVDVTVGPLAVAGRDFAMAITEAGDVAPATALLHGRVLAADGRPLGDALVTLDGPAGVAGAIEAQSDSSGRFRLPRLPSGTQSGTVTVVGFMPRRFVTELRADDSTSVELRLEPVQALATVTVTDQGGFAGRTSVSVTQALERAKMGFGRIVHGAELARMPQTRSVFNGLPGVRIAQVPPEPFTRELIELLAPIDGRPPRLDPGSWVAISPTGARLCILRIFVDGRETDTNEMMSLNPQMLRAVEVYNRRNEVPAFVPTVSTYGDPQCGAVLMWTVMAP